MPAHAVEMQTGPNANRPADATRGQVVVWDVRAGVEGLSGSEADNSSQALTARLAESLTNAHPLAGIVPFRSVRGGSSLQNISDCQPPRGAWGVVIALVDEASASDACDALASLAADEPVLVLCLGPGPVDSSAYSARPWLVRCESVPGDAQLAAMVAVAMTAASGRAVAQWESHLHHRAAQAAERAIEAMQREAHLAAVLQSELAPHSMPEVAGWQCAVMVRASNGRGGVRGGPSDLCMIDQPAACAGLSGDHVEIARLDEHHLSFFAADACGHGAAAALLVVLAARLLTTKQTWSGGYRLLSPGEVMTRLNDAFMERRGTSGLSVSAVYGTIDTRTGLVTCCSAGYPPLLIFGAADASSLHAGGPPLGTCEGIAYHGGEATLARGGSLLLLSDGFEHTFVKADASTPPRVSALCSLLSERCAQELVAMTSLVSQGASPAAALESLLHRLQDDTGSLHQRDDMTLVLISRDRS